MMRMKVNAPDFGDRSSAVESCRQQEPLGLMETATRISKNSGHREVPG